MFTAIMAHSVRLIITQTNTSQCNVSALHAAREPVEST